jgi:hypothetical protein
MGVKLGPFPQEKKTMRVTKNVKEWKYIMKNIIFHVIGVIKSRMIRRKTHATRAGEIRNAC